MKYKRNSTSQKRKLDKIYQTMVIKTLDIRKQKQLPLRNKKQKFPNLRLFPGHRKGKGTQGRPQHSMK
jgi:hypothetical protein